MTEESKLRAVEIRRTVYIDHWIWRALRLRAVKEGTTASALVNDILAKSIRRDEGDGSGSDVLQHTVGASEG